MALGYPLRRDILGSIPYETSIIRVRNKWIVLGCALLNRKSIQTSFKWG